MAFKVIAMWSCPHAIAHQLIQPPPPLITVNELLLMLRITQTAMA